MQIVENRIETKIRNKINVFRVALIVLFVSNFLNIGNYSFLSYSYSGFPTSIAFFEFLKYFRLPMVLIGLLLLVVLQYKNHSLSRYFLYNIDIFIFLSFTYLGLLNSLDIINGVFYTIWLTGAFVIGLYSMFYLKRYNSNMERVQKFFKFLFWSNFIVLPLLILNLPSFGKNWSYDMAFASSTFYPYCLLSMLISIYGNRLFTSQSLFKIKYSFVFEIIIVFLIIIFCFMSARRTPLFLMITLSLIYSFFVIGTSIFKKILLSVILISLGIILLPKLSIYIEKHKYELSILKKINDLQNANGDIGKDASYNERVILWGLYDNIIALHPFIGTGSYNSTVFLKKHFPNSRMNGYSTHNLFRGILVEHGFLGLLSFIVIVLRSCYLILMKSKLKYAFYYFAFLLIPILIINWNEYNLLAGQVFFWTTVLVILFPRMCN